MKPICFIPARGSSKWIKEKIFVNIKYLIKNIEKTIY